MYHPRWTPARLEGSDGLDESDWSGRSTDSTGARTRSGGHPQPDRAGSVTSNVVVARSPPS
jgi:hypothetical protein